MAIEAYLDAIEEVLDRKLSGDCGREGDAILKRIGDLAAQALGRCPLDLTTKKGGHWCVLRSDNVNR